MEGILFYHDLNTDLDPEEFAEINELCSYYDEYDDTIVYAANREDIEDYIKEVWEPEFREKYDNQTSFEDYISEFLEEEYKKISC